MEITTHTCPRHGDYRDESGMSAQHECPTCQTKAQAHARDFRAKWRNWEYWLDESGVPDRYRTRTITNWTPADNQQRTVAKLLQRYQDDLVQRVQAGDGLTLMGPPGVGKTHVMTALVSAACNVGIRAVYTAWPDLIERHRRAMRAPQDDPDKQALYRASCTPLLALDEIGLSAGTDYEKAQLFELIDSRYREQLATLIATNATTKTLPDLIGERLADRLREMSTSVVMAGTSQRGIAKHGKAPALEPPPASITVVECYQGQTRERVIEHQQTGGYLS